MHIRTIGQGPDLVMLHGWSMHSAVWYTLAESMKHSFTLHLVDLPGHGKSSWQDSDLQLNNLLTNLAIQLPENAYFLGWSLGGLIAIAFAKKYPEKVNKLILMGSTPRFVQESDWECAIGQEVLESFRKGLYVNQERTLQKFLFLQGNGSKRT